LKKTVKKPAEKVARKKPVARKLQVNMDPSIDELNTWVKWRGMAPGVKSAEFYELNRVCIDRVAEWKEDFVTRVHVSLVCEGVL